MERANQSIVLEFILLGFSDDPDLEVLLFIIFFLAYMIAVLGNLLIILVIYFSHNLHTPMYFFLGNLSFLDIGSTSTTIPNMLVNILLEKKVISYLGCVVQLYMFTWLCITEMMLLTIMAYDRYAAICSPLTYRTVLNWRVCVQGASVMWAVGAVSAMAHTIATFRLSFCGPNRISHFFCEIPPVLMLSCSDTTLNEVMLITTDIILGLLCFLFIIISYVFIVLAILKIRSTTGKQKAFATCASHLTVVILYYGTLFLTYVQPKSSSSPEQRKVMSALYTVFIPMLNPIIYSMRNKEVKDALKKIIQNRLYSCLLTFVRLPS
ncbi:olfactory receptor 5V1-like [Microcaecilia unicolor]|uniref:Olfactory receptor n=1 Tax=Microcaecilia unicolor TaxID=1415580 RepID=A0A6P7WN25_9AMPH|nr:olfactory receptor 5V1-like [Microcaecilia unicolor]